MGSSTPHFRRRTAALAALAVAGCAGARTPGVAGPEAGADGRRAFVVPGHGALVIVVPPGWRAEASDDGDDPSAPRTIRLEQPGASFLALLTPFWDPGVADDEAAHGDTARLFAELARRNALAGSVEPELPLNELAGEGVRGFWFGATDRELVGKEPGPEEWRHVLQGAVGVGELVVAFTLLDNGPGPQREVLLEVVRCARHVPAAEEEGDVGAARPTLSSYREVVVAHQLRRTGLLHDLGEGLPSARARTRSQTWDRVDPAPPHPGPLPRCRGGRGGEGVGISTAC